eukprot:s390_g8.t1
MPSSPGPEHFGPPRNMDAAVTLVQVHADPYLKDRWGHTALMEAKDNGHYDLVEVMERIWKSHQKRKKQEKDTLFPVTLGTERWFCARYFPRNWLMLLEFFEFVEEFQPQGMSGAVVELCKGRDACDAHGPMDAVGGWSSTSDHPRSDQIQTPEAFVMEKQ